MHNRLIAPVLSILIFALSPAAHAACSGNACDDLTMEVTFRPNSQAIQSVLLKNIAAKKIQYKMTWGDALGGCTITITGSLQPSATTVVTPPSEITMGFCKTNVTK
jgi:hypothetical protein